MSQTHRRQVLFTLFFLSGFTGLIYESLWSHYLKLFLGHAALAQSLVLAIFMGGMASGAALAARFSPSGRNLLAAYGVIEALIGGFALIFHPLFEAVLDLSFERVMPGLGTPEAVSAYQWTIAAVLLFPAAVCLGATFPLMSGAVIRRFPGSDGGNLAGLYFSNSIGAAIGALVVSFVFIPWIGLPGTLVLAGIINLAIGSAAWWLGRQPEAAPAAIAKPETVGQLPVLLLSAAFITGAASFVYEVSWIRMLALVLGGTFHAFELMLSAFITGLALGSLAIRRHIDRFDNPLAAGAWVQVGMGVLAVLTLPVYVQSFEWMAALVNTLEKNEQGYLLFNFASHGIAFAVMLPATLLAGMTLPLFTRALLRSGYGEQSIGRIYAANALGAIAGVLFALHLAMPALGVKLTLAAGALLDIGLGVLMLRYGLAAERRDWLAALAALLVPVLVVRLVNFDPTMLGGGVYRTGHARLEEAKALFHKDGKTTTVTTIFQAPSGVVLATNGKPDASIEMNPRLPAARDEVTMVMAGAVPLAMRPDAKHVANIGFGSGLTTHTVLASPGVEEMATIEIESAVIEGSRAFLPRVNRAYQDPRSRIFIEDAKSWFARHNRRFDVIISEPSNPWVSGVASLFSEEFYRQIGRYLTDEGLLVQWINLYEFDTRLAASVIAALNRHFSDYAVYLTDDSDALIVAVKLGRVPALSAAIFDQPETRRELDRVGIHSRDDLAFRLIGTARTLTPMLAALRAPANSDYYPYVEQGAPRARFLGSEARELPLLRIVDLPLIEMLHGDGARWNTRSLTPAAGWRFQKVAEALRLRAAMRGESALDEAPGLWASLQPLLRDCAGLERAEVLDPLHELAVASLPFLDRETAQTLWRDPGWLGCREAQWPAQVARRIALYRAVAKRDGVAMLDLARTALDESAGTSIWDQYVMIAGLLGARSLQDHQTAGELWRRYGGQVFPDRRFPAELVMLLGMQ